MDDLLEGILEVAYGFSNGYTRNKKRKSQSTEGNTMGETDINPNENLVKKPTQKREKRYGVEVNYPKGSRTGYDGDGPDFDEEIRDVEVTMPRYESESGYDDGDPDGIMDVDTTVYESSESSGNERYLDRDQRQKSRKAKFGEAINRKLAGKGKLTKEDVKELGKKAKDKTVSASKKSYEVSKKIGKGTLTAISKTGDALSRMPSYVDDATDMTVRNRKNTAPPIQYESEQEEYAEPELEQPRSIQKQTNRSRTTQRRTPTKKTTGTRTTRNQKKRKTGSPKKKTTGTRSAGKKTGKSVKKTTKKGGKSVKSPKKRKVDTRSDIEKWAEDGLF